MTAAGRLREADRWVTSRIAAWDSPYARHALPAVGWAAKHSKVWCASAALMAGFGGRRGRTAARAGLSAVALGQVAATFAVKPLTHRARPPRQLIHHQTGQRPESSSFPSGHTAAAVAFTASVGRTWPAMGAVCAVPAAMVSFERVYSGAHYPSDVAAGAVVGLAAARLVSVLPLLRQHSTGKQGKGREACCLFGFGMGRRAMSS
ncbi:phosphatase PAP2 family protein [Streptomyces sp. ME19-03-3]|nr:phosphatase PAP2 family protein [Streptomyces sp. ME19-03-3]